MNTTRSSIRNNKLILDHRFGFRLEHGTIEHRHRPENMKRSKEKILALKSQSGTLPLFKLNRHILSGKAKTPLYPIRVGVPQ